MVYVEVSLGTSFYLGGPLFADVDVAMRASGFQFIKFVGFVPYPRVTDYLTVDLQAGLPDSTMVEANALYIANMTRVKSLPQERLLKLCVILHECFFAYDIVLHLLSTLEERDYAAEYADLLINRETSARSEHYAPQYSCATMAQF